MSLLNSYGKFIKFTQLVPYKDTLSEAPVFVPRDMIVKISPDLGDEPFDDFTDEDFAECGTVISLLDGSNVRVAQGFAFVLQIIG